jgi:hypothetical protein
MRKDRWPAAKPGTCWLLRGVLALAALAVAQAQMARAGGGPENLFLVVNSRSVSSLAVANHYIALRKIPSSNILHVDWDGGTEGIDIDAFRRKLLVPMVEAMTRRGLAGQIDYLVYSSDFPYHVDFASDLPPNQRNLNFLSASLTSLTYLDQPVLAHSLEFASLTSNHYMQLGKAPADTVPSHGFRSWYGWGPRGELLESGGSHYFLSTMLAFTSGRGNTLDEAVSYLRRSAAADGTRPKGTVYFARNSDVRSTTRQGGFAAAVKALDALGVRAEIFDGAMPSNKPDVAGTMLGSADFNWKQSGSTILPGAICENLTSYGGILSSGAGQTPLTEFLRFGAAGSSGTVIEPYAIQNKFPVPAIFVHYAQGCSLAEAFYQSVWGPYQLLIVGDPLCRPWARIPTVQVDGVKGEAKIKGKLSLKPSAKSVGGEPADRFELFANGLRLARCNLGESLELDTTKLPDGFCELRIVAIESGPIETQGELIVPVTVANRNLAIDWKPSATQLRAGELFHITASAPGAESIAVLQDYRLLGQIQGAKGELTLDSASLGTGPARLHTEARMPAGGVVSGAPVMVEIQAAAKH